MEATKRDSYNQHKTQDKENYFDFVVLHEDIQRETRGIIFGREFSD